MKLGEISAKDTKNEQVQIGRSHQLKINRQKNARSTVSNHRPFTFKNHTTAQFILSFLWNLWPSTFILVQNVRLGRFILTYEGLFWPQHLFSFLEKNIWVTVWRIRRRNVFKNSWKISSSLFLNEIETDWLILKIWDLLNRG